MEVSFLLDLVYLFCWWSPYFITIIRTENHSNLVKQIRLKPPVRRYSSRRTPWCLHFRREYKYNYSSHQLSVCTDSVSCSGWRGQLFYKHLFTHASAMISVLKYCLTESNYMLVFLFCFLPWVYFMFDFNLYVLFANFLKWWI